MYGYEEYYLMGWDTTLDVFGRTNYLHLQGQRISQASRE
jgi:hypothetical protein